MKKIRFRLRTFAPLVAITSVVSVAAVASCRQQVPQIPSNNANNNSNNNNNNNPSNNQSNPSTNTNNNNNNNPSNPTTPQPTQTNGFNLLNPTSAQISSIANQNLIKNKTFSSFSSSAYQNVPYNYDGTTSYGGLRNNQDYVLTSSNFVTIDTIQTPLYQQEQSLARINLSRAGAYALRLGYADQVILKMPDGSFQYFNSDSYTPVSNAQLNVAPSNGSAEQQTVGGANISNGYIQLTSTDPNSINSPQFAEALKKSVGISFRVRQNMTWTNYQGDVVKNSSGSPYYITGKDFYYGYLRSRVFASNSLRDSYAVDSSENADQQKASLDAMTALNQLVNNDSPSSLSAFQASGTEIDNSYLYGLFGYNAKDLFDESKLVTSNGGRDFINFYALPASIKDNQVDTSALLNVIMKGSSFIPAPIEYIEANNNNANVLFQYNSRNLPQFKAEYDKLDKNSLLYKLGFYWYGYNIQNTFSTGKYYVPLFDGTNRIESFNLNTHYYDQSFVNDPRSIKTYQNHYQQQTTSPDAAYYTSDFQLLKTGSESVGSFLNYSANDQSTILNDPSQYSLQFNSNINVSRPNISTFFNLLPISNGGNNTDLMNDAATQLLYGSSKDSILNGTATDVTVNATNSYALSFKSILSAALNIYEYARQVRFQSKDRVLPWYSPYTTDVTFNGSDAPNNFGERLTPRKEYYKSNSIFVVDQNGNKVELNINGSQTTQLGVFDSVSQSFISGASTAIQSVAYPQLQKIMTALLDQFYEAHPSLVDNGVDTPIQITYPIFGGFGPNFDTLGEQIGKAWSGLDTKNRLKISFASLTGPKNVDYFSAANSPLNPWEFTGWSYDYNGITSAFDGFTQSNHFILVMFGILTNQTYRAFIEKSYPDLVQVADGYLQYLMDNKIQLRVRNQTNSYGTALSKYTGRFMMTTNGDKQSYLNIFAQFGKMPISSVTPALTELVTGTNDLNANTYQATSSSYWKSLSSTYTVSQLNELAAEFKNFLFTGPIMDSINSYVITKPTPTSAFPGTPKTVNGQFEYFGELPTQPALVPSIYLNGYSVPFSLTTQFGDGSWSNLKLSSYLFTDVNQPISSGASSVATSDQTQVAPYTSTASTTSTPASTTDSTPAQNN